MIPNFFIRIAVLLGFLLGIWGCQQKDPIIRFAEDNKMDKELYLYPSTLRMMNIEQNADFNRLIDQFEKGQYFTLSKSDSNTDLVEGLKQDLTKNGYEEAMTFEDRQSKIKVFVIEKKSPVIAAIVESDSIFNIIQMEGIVNFTMIPKLIQEFNKDDFMDINRFVQIK